MIKQILKNLIILLVFAAGVISMLILFVVIPLTIEIFKTIEL